MVKTRNTPIFAILTHFAKCCRSGYKFQCVLLLCSHVFAFKPLQIVKTQVLQPLCIAILIICCKNSPPPAQTPILMILRVRTIGSTFVWNAANWQTIDFTDDFYLFFPLCRAPETGFNLHFWLKLSESSCSSLSCLKTPKNVKNCFNPYSFFYTCDEKGQFRPISP